MCGIPIPGRGADKVQIHQPTTKLRLDYDGHILLVEDDVVEWNFWEDAIEAISTLEQHLVRVLVSPVSRTRGGERTSSIEVGGREDEGVRGVGAWGGVHA